MDRPLRLSPAIEVGARGATRAPRAPVFLWVSAGLVSAAMLLPLAYLFLRALGAGDEIWPLLLRPRTAQVLGRSVVLVGVVTAFALALALPLAWLTVRTDLPGRRAWALLTALPLVFPSYVVGFIIVTALGPRGTLQQVLAPLGVNRLPEIYGLPGAAMVVLIVAYPYALLTLQGALRGIDTTTEDVSRSLGRGPWTTFLRVTLPQLKPALAAAAVLVALYALSDFGAVSLLRYETFTWAIYIQYQTSFDRMLAAGLALVLMGVAGVILLGEALVRGRASYYRSGVGVGAAPRPVRLGRWRWPALALCSSVTAVTLALPVAVLLYWAARGLASGQSLEPVWQAALSSLSVSGVAAAVTVVAALPIVVLTVRHAGRVASLMERSAYVGFALPGIVVALALVFFAANFVRPLYQTLVVLVFAYVVLFLPQAIGAARASLLQVSPRLEEAARTLGRTPLRAMTSITVPLMRPGILAGFGLVFLTTMKELPATLLLSPFGFKTLATSIWSATEEAFFARAAVAALVLVLASSLPMALLISRERRTRP